MWKGYGLPRWHQWQRTRLPASGGDVRDMGSISESRRSPGERNGKSLQYSCLENSMDRGAQRGCTVWHDWSDLAHTHVRGYLAEGRWGFWCKTRNGETLGLNLSLLPWWPRVSRRSRKKLLPRSLCDRTRCLSSRHHRESEEAECAVTNTYFSQEPCPFKK